MRRDLNKHESRQFITGRDFHRHIIKADTHALLCRYSELVDCGDAVDASGIRSLGDADAFVSWNWDSEWETLMGALGRAHAARCGCGQGCSALLARHVRGEPAHGTATVAVPEWSERLPWMCCDG